jgi:hypothetical protein
MCKINDGGPAFPSTIQYFPDDKNAAEEQGMTLRDWFAGQALAGLLRDGIDVHGIDDSAYLAYEMADAAYEMADAMLKVREVKP